MYKGGSFHSLPYVSYSSHRFGLSPPFTGPFPLTTVFPPLFSKFLPSFTVFFLPFVILPPSIHRIFLLRSQYLHIHSSIYPFVRGNSSSIYGISASIHSISASICSSHTSVHSVTPSTHYISNSLEYFRPRPLQHSLLMEKLPASSTLLFLPLTESLFPA